MFSDTFYPTPRHVARRMLAGLNLDSTHHILDPSAGKGDLLDAITDVGDQYSRQPERNVYAIEIVPELVSILEGKGYPVVGRDFLTYVPTRQYTHIIMNPPWDQAEQHLLAAWRLLYSGMIVALMPAAALEGKHAGERLVLELIRQHGTTEPIGAAFARGAERRTDHEAVIVRLTKLPPGGDRLEWELHNDREDYAAPELENRELALEGYIDNLLANHDAALAAFSAYNTARQKLSVYCEAIKPPHVSTTAISASDAARNPQLRHNHFVSTLTEQAWTRILDHPGFQRMLTKRARDMMAEFRLRQQRVDFNRANVEAMITALLAKRDDLLMAAILDAFDNLTKYHQDNRVHVEGWKSNEAWKVARKCILPYAVSTRWAGNLEIRYGDREELNDIDRALCVVAGLPYDEILKVTDACEASMRARKGPGLTESTFFDPIRYYKKGTLHLTFRDPALLEQFNLTAARGRGWLPSPKEGGFA